MIVNEAASNSDTNVAQVPTVIGKPELAGVALRKKQQSGSKRMAEVRGKLNQRSKCNGQEHSSSYLVTILAILSSKKC